MAITRKDIREKFGAEANVSDTEIKALLDMIHAEVDGIRDERDQLQNQLNAANKSLESVTAAKDKAEKDLTDFKTEQATKATKSAKEAAYKALLAAAGINEKRQAAITKIADLDGLELNADGSLKNADKITESIKTDFAEFISVPGAQGAKVNTPPGNNTGKAAFDAMSLSEQMVFANSHPAEYAEYTK